MVTPAIICCLLAASSFALPTPQEDEIVSDKEKPEVRALHINSNINYRYAETVIRSLVVNPASTAKEYIFHVVLPEEAFITGFVMTINEKDYPAHVGEKEKAKKEYDDAVSAGFGAAHVAYNARDSNDFKININIEPEGKVWFNLTYEDFLPRTLGSYEHKININPGQIVDDMMITVSIMDKLPLINVKVPELKMSNEITFDEEVDNELAKLEKVSEEKVKVTWAPSADEQRALKKDGVSGQFIVKYDVDRSKDTQQVLVKDGYFVHFFSNDQLPSLNKHVVFILDLSGSMAGTKMAQLKTAMIKILSDLKTSDYFSIVLFSNTAEAWAVNGTVPKLYSYYNNNNNEKKFEITPSHVIEASAENVESAKTFINSLDDMGGTNIIAGLRVGLSIAKMGTQLLENETPTAQPKPIIVFLTDGEPNIEESDPSRITELATTSNKGLSPIFSLGFGVGADMKFLKNLSLANNAFARHIYEASDAALQLEQFFKMISSPLLSDVKFDYVPEEVADVTKVNFFSMYAGEELVVAGRLNKQDACAHGKVAMTKLDGTQEMAVPNCIIITDQDFVWPDPPIAPPELKNRTFGPLEKLWAYKTIKQLLDNHTLTQNEDAKKEALKLALQYSFVTPLTSLVVVKPNETTSVNAEKADNLATRGIAGSPFGYAMSPGPMPAVAFSNSAAVAFSNSAHFGGLAPAAHPVFAGAPGGASGSLGYGGLADVSLLSVSAADRFDKVAMIGLTTTYTPDTEEKVDISEIAWVDQSPVDINGSSFLQPIYSEVPQAIPTDLIALNMTAKIGDPCNVGVRRHLCIQFIDCPLNVFSNDSSIYYNEYKCLITDDSGYEVLGVCCPNSLSNFLQNPPAPLPPMQAATAPDSETVTETAS